MTVWLDANVLIRFLTGDPPDQARRARRLMQRAAAGEISLRVATVVIAEVVWVLGSFYDRGRAEIAEAIRSLVVADGVAAEDADLLLEALRLMADANVAYVDAYLAASARRAAEPVASFDAAFRRLGVELAPLP